MTDAEISRRLALAIGWFHANYLATGIVYVSERGSRICMPFDYRDPAVIWPIAERFDCFPIKDYLVNAWEVTNDRLGVCEYADTAAKAVALAVIKAHEGAKE